MQRGKSWPEFFFYIARVLVLMVLLAVVLPKLVTVCSMIITSNGDKDERPSGNPMRVEEEGSTWSEFVIQLFPDIKR